jgi:hypothetical protein
MLLLALMISGLNAPAQAASQAMAPVAQVQMASSEVYAAPAIRPYEPPSDFGRQVAEGDADAAVRTRPLTAPVAVEAYAETYESLRSPREISYDQGVETARARQNARMGPLDGVWTAVDAEGRPVLDLVLSDRGARQPVEGGLRFARTDRTALIEDVSSDGDARIIRADLDGRPVTLSLHPTADGWSGDLTGNGPRQSVSLTRQP